MAGKKVKISSFLTERKDRFKPAEANKLGLKRVNKIDFSGNIHLVEHKPTKTNMILVKKGDLLISGINAEKGGVAIYNFDKDAIATIHYSSYTYNPKKIKVDYLKWFLKSNTFKRILIEQAGSGIKSELKPKKFLSLEIELPTIEEQESILEKIKSVNAEILELRSMIEENELFIEKLRKTTLQDALRGKLTEDWRNQNPNKETANELLLSIKAEKKKLVAEKKIKKDNVLPPIKIDEIPFDIPTGWTWCRFSDVANIASNLVKPEQYLDFPHIAPNNIEKGTGKLLEYNTVKEDKLISSKHHFKKGQILYSKIRPHLNKVVVIEFTGLCSADMYPIDSFINKHYLFYYMLSEVFVNQTMKAEGRVAMPKINQKELSKILIPLPLLQEQVIIINKVEQLLDLYNKLKNEVIESKINAEILMQSLLSKLFGDENSSAPIKLNIKKEEIKPVRDTKFDSKTINMKLQELLKEHGKLHAEDLWKMSEFPKDIDKFYAELKKQIEDKKTIKEVKNEKGYLELS